MFIRIVIDFGEFVKGDLKSWGTGKGVGGLGKWYEAAGFFDPCVCLGIFLLW
jgi:hypothetical protein